MQRAAIIVLIGGVFAAGLGADASREHIMNIFGKLGSEGQKVFINKTDEGILDAGEERDRKQIKDKLGINVPKLIYKPEGMEYESYELDDRLQTVNMKYLTADEKYYYVYISQRALDSQEVIEIDGEVIKQHLLSVSYLEKGVKVEQIQEEGGRSLYKADFYYNNVYYLFMGEMEKEEFDEIIKKMIF